MYCCNTVKYLGRNDQKWGNKREWLIIIQRGKCRNHSRFNYSTHPGYSSEISLPQYTSHTIRR